MKKMNSLLMLFAIVAFGLTNCASENDPIVTQEIEKIETSYTEGAIKLETESETPKVETRASDLYIAELVNKLDSEMEALLTSRTSGRIAAATDYDIGLIASATSPCSGERIRIFMDCEDSNGKTNVVASSTSILPPWPVDGNKNITMYFCRVDGRTYMNGTPYGSKHYVLQLGPIRVSGYPVIRYFDNEDKNNKNSYTGIISPSTGGGNFRLCFSALSGFKGYPQAWGTNPFVLIDLPNTFTTNYNTFEYNTDDEDNNNANYWIVNGGAGGNTIGSLFNGTTNTHFTIIVQ